MDRYRNLERWSYRRWAWEFLRRNSQFIAACKEIASQGTKEQRQEIADKFGLKKFKPYSDGYTGEHGKPVFSVGSITSWAECDADQGQANRSVRAALRSGQVLIRFDLASAVTDPKVLEKQLRSAETRLEKCRKSYAEASHQALAAKTHPHKVSLFGQYLRLLDSDATGRLQIDSGLLIAPAKVKRLESQYHTTSRSNLAPAINKKMSRAIEYTKHLYRSLAVLKGCPKVKSVPLEE